MATAATRLKLETLRSSRRYHISRFEIPSVAADDTSEVYSLDVGVREGVLELLRIASVSGEDYDISLRNIEGATLPSMAYTVNEIYREEAIGSTGFQGRKLGIIYSNDGEIEDPVPNTPHLGEETLLYLQVVNNHATTATGTITIECVIASGD